MARHFEGINGVSSDFLKVLLQLKTITKKETHVATLAIVSDTSKSGEGLYTCQIIPTLNDENDKMISVYCVEGLTLQENDVVLILFLDNNFVQNLKQIRRGQKISKLQSQSETHSESYGIIINKVQIS